MVFFVFELHWKLPPPLFTIIYEGFTYPKNETTLLPLLSCTDIDSFI